MKNFYSGDCIQQVDHMHAANITILQFRSTHLTLLYTVQYCIHALFSHKSCIIFSQIMHYFNTNHALFSHKSCIIFSQIMHHFHTNHALFSHKACIIDTQIIHNFHTNHALFSHKSCIIFAQIMHYFHTNHALFSHKSCCIVMSGDCVHGLAVGGRSLVIPQDGIF